MKRFYYKEKEVYNIHASPPEVSYLVAAEYWLFLAFC